MLELGLEGGFKYIKMLQFGHRPSAGLKQHIYTGATGCENQSKRTNHSNTVQPQVTDKHQP